MKNDTFKRDFVCYTADKWFISLKNGLDIHFKDINTPLMRANYPYDVVECHQYSCINGVQGNYVQNIGLFDC